VGHTDTNTNPHLFHHLIHDGLKTQKVITDRADQQTLGTKLLGLQPFRPRKYLKSPNPGSGAFPFGAGNTFGTQNRNFELATFF